MFKTLTAALIAASMLIAPMAANAAQPAIAPASATVKVVKRHVVKHHARAKFAKHARPHTKFGVAQAPRQDRARHEDPEACDR